MKAALFAPLLALTLASPARAEHLLFDHVLYPPLEQSLANKTDSTILYDDSNPAYVFDRIVVRGASQQNWDEALEIIARTPADGVRTVDDWYQEIAAKGRTCPSQFTVVHRDHKSLTFLRHSQDCSDGTPDVGLYRLVAGKRTLYLLNALSKHDLDTASRDQWLALLASARLAG